MYSVYRQPQINKKQPGEEASHPMGNDPKPRNGRIMIFDTPHGDGPLFVQLGYTRRWASVKNLGTAEEDRGPKKQ